MHITQITINFSETCNLGDYSNTKPSVELTAQLDVTDDVHVVLDELVTTAKGVIHEKIDNELERVGKPPKYWDGERYDVIYSYRNQFVAIVPAATISQLDGGFSRYLEGVRLPAAQQAAQIQLGHVGNSEAVEFFDCSLTADTAALRSYATEKNAIYEQEEQKRRQREEEERRQRQAAWEAKYQTSDEEDEDEEEEDEEEEDE
ncbi:MAG: hypothetical protein KF832_25175 [Caldilineaceae bacterium]|nr:hypothetical protein [Caldilineaceae bacterium]